MKRLTHSVLITLVSLALGSPALSADERPNASCIELWPDSKGFESMMPSSDMSKSVDEELTGTTAHLVVYVDHFDDNGRSVFIPFKRDMHVFATKSGKYVVRIRALPDDHGWFGPF